MEKRNRIYMIDVVRGTAVFMTLLLSNPGTSLRPATFIHAQWHGITFIDYFLPLFIFAMSMVIPLVFERDRFKAPKAFLFRVFRRSILLFLLGMLLNFTPEFNPSTLRILGVLQRLGLVYFAVNIYLLILRKYISKKHMIAVLLVSGLIFCFLYMLLIHPWGYEMETNLIRRIDLRVITEAHMYKPLPHDPEGLLSTIGAIVSGLFGSAIGYLLIDKEKPQKNKLVLMLLLGCGFLLLSFVTGIRVPINKKMWTGTYLLHTTGWITLYTALCFFLCDIQQIRKPFQFLTYLGRNALFIYVAAEFISKLVWPIQIYYPVMDETLRIPAYITFRFFQPLVGTLLEGVGFGLLYALLWVLVAKLMYKKNIMIKL